MIDLAFEHALIFNADSQNSSLLPRYALSTIKVENFWHLPSFVTRRQLLSTTVLGRDSVAR